MALDIYKTITDRIIQLLDEGTIPWRHPIRSTGSDGKLPTNLASDREYRGINVFLLAVTAWAEGFESPYWLTFRQAREKGGHVRKGEKGSLVIFWKQHSTKDRETGEDITVPVLRYYKVFNADQCSGIDIPGVRRKEETDRVFEPIEACARIVEGYTRGPVIEHKGSAAFYTPKSDTVRVPGPERFESSESYYATLFHELVHSTGHSSRLDRGLDRATRPFGSPDYSKEELIAEMGSAFLCAAGGISTATIEQSAAYIQGWRSKLEQDKKLIVTAAGGAQKAADWIVGARL